MWMKKPSAKRPASCVRVRVREGYTRRESTVEVTSGRRVKEAKSNSLHWLMDSLTVLSLSFFESMHPLFRTIQCTPSLSQCTQTGTQGYLQWWWRKYLSHAFFRFSFFICYLWPFTLSPRVSTVDKEREGERVKWNRVEEANTQDTGERERGKHHRSMRRKACNIEVTNNDFQKQFNFVFMEKRRKRGEQEKR